MSHTNSPPQSQYKNSRLYLLKTSSLQGHLRNSFHLYEWVSGFFFKDISYNLTLAGRTIRFTCTSYHKITDQMSIIGVLKNEKSDNIKITVDIQCNKYMF